MFKRWYPLNTGSHFYVSRRGSFVCVLYCVCVCVCLLGKIVFMTFPTLIERMKFFFCHTLDICFLWKAFTCPPTKQMCNQFQYHVPLLILQQQVVTNKQTKGKYSSQAYIYQHSSESDRNQTSQQIVERRHQLSNLHAIWRGREVHPHVRGGVKRVRGWGQQMLQI